MSAATELTFRYDSGCLIATATGRYVIEHKEAAVRSVAAAIKARPVRAALIDMRGLKPPYGFLDRYQLGELAGRHLTAVPVAILITEALTDPDHFGKIVANNRGARVELFIQEAQACAWLKQHQIPAA
jgi:hypothetical protein